MEADDYLHTGDHGFDLSSADITEAEGQLDENGSTVIDMVDNSQIPSSYRIRNGSLNSRPRDNHNGSLHSSVSYNP